MGLTISPLTAILVGIWYLLVQQVEGNYLIPRIMGRSVSLHPLIILVAIFAGFQLNGIVGALLAVPVAGVIQVVMRYLPRNSHETAANAGSDAPNSSPPPADVIHSQETAVVEDEATTSAVQASGI